MNGILILLMVTCMLQATAYLKELGVSKQVYQIEGGIHRYAEQFPDGHFKGKNYVFDNRVAVKVTDDILGSCYGCSTPCDDYINCLNVQCNHHCIMCAQCRKNLHGCCSQQCMDLVQTAQVKQRPAPHTHAPSQQ